jgi:N-acetylglutamate synthase-like GNAT family acetyltransferase
LGKGGKRQIEIERKVLDCLAVHPNHKRHGIASMLVESGLNETEKMGFDTFATACSDGKCVYECVGFRLLEHIVRDDREWGAHAG